MASVSFAGFSNNLIPGKLKSGASREFHKRPRVRPIRAASRLSAAAKTTIPPLTAQKNASPWLMLPPVFEGGPNSGPPMSYKLYSLSEDRVLSVGAKDGDRMDVVGSSHGWLALLDPNTRDLFLYNPISGRHINLPQIHFPRTGSRRFRVNQTHVDRLILSCSPDEDEQNCRAIIIYGWLNSMAFCCPGSSQEWTRIHPLDDDVAGFQYRNCVYSTEHNLLFALTWSYDLISCDLTDPLSPKVSKIAHKFVDNRRMDFPVNLTCEPVEHLVAAGQDLLLVTQYVLQSVGPDGLYIDSNDDPTGSIYEQGLPDLTVDFDVDRYDPASGDFKRVEDLSLGGWSLFVGRCSNAVALQPADECSVKPGSIYFTDVFGDLNCGRDIGVFNYEKKMVSPCNYPFDYAHSFEKILRAPMWFFPTPT
ncbi:hypothetical protein STAS_18469 [Striga asiatica]|uniref:KIB1-4 beta-propeller domain-containing protein n=1 Tax=Striga asiatica TaxID=4170 RepID=A0A5A7Q919_STRAF|nr:hypothetical protein STAS_18469 [Striga asiatica]